MSNPKSEDVSLLLLLLVMDKARPDFWDGAKCLSNDGFCLSEVDGMWWLIFLSLPSAEGALI